MPTNRIGNLSLGQTFGMLRPISHTGTNQVRRDSSPQSLEIGSHMNVP